MKVPFLDVRSAYIELKSEIDEAVSRALDSGWYIFGEEVARFERSFADYTGTRFAIGVGNGLDALRIALMAMGVSEGDEVIVPSNTYIATWLAVTQCGAHPVPVEPDANTLNIDPQRIEQAMTSKTKVILPVHLYGLPAQMGPILELARRKGVRVLEDGAQAHGARYRGELIGGHGDAVTWSFYPGKNLGAFGDAGGVTTNDAELAEQIRTIANYGSKVKYVNEVCGVNSRLDPLHAAALSVKLPHLEEWNTRRVQIAEYYQRHLQNTSVRVPVSPPDCVSSWHLFPVFSRRRDALQARLKEAGIETLIHYPIPPHLQQAYRFLGYEKGAFPIAEAMAETELSLPIGPHMTLEQAAYVCEIIAGFE
ncbi:DegT/DnrJ/EryC1/StrS family aminotransferase [Paraburkholderia sabiae]|uniref:DegT/DnrJ/EryC1/StrS family aminotransferase n=1 Tax=Paraburkholderia sabiae TaxID=273251 RepID=A0ABU9QJR1_9BURK|nr:DegT/DnrJ/EryC1/StrS family aminotransferase [Paraburkholderia sabiae]WJZ73496.1 DegT/DnrJ/EryC1/StrS family aminotransferase [Paraburkholderia sabiae]CAD6542114.1 dTDP-3-amino-3,6-dideoxy-alpha-D-galactopyranose transaminase [Paraburkholderia sabiae]